MNNFLVEEVNRLEKVLQLLYDGERKLQSRIDAALAIYENDPYDPKLERAAAMAQALKGEA